MSFQSLTILKSTKDDQGLYECTIVDHSGNTKTKTEFIRVLEQVWNLVHFIQIFFFAKLAKDCIVLLYFDSDRDISRHISRQNRCQCWRDRKVDPTKSYFCQGQVICKFMKSSPLSFWNWLLHITKLLSIIWFKTFIFKNLFFEKLSL